MVGWIILIGVVMVMGFIRLAPVDVGRWHQPILADVDKDMKIGAIRVVPAGADGLARVNEVMLGLERTVAIAGSVEEGRITYVTRSAVFGFPDFTTAEQDGDVVKMFARLRFGGSDLGVNRKRLERVLAALKL